MSSQVLSEGRSALQCYSGMGRCAPCPVGSRVTVLSLTGPPCMGTWESEFRGQSLEKGTCLKVRGFRKGQIGLQCHLFPVGF
jgi:hypothetical protein